jgi:hypothetical protein
MKYLKGFNEDRIIPPYCEKITKKEFIRRTSKDIEERSRNFLSSNWGNMGSSDLIPYDPANFNKFEIGKLEQIFKTWKDVNMDKYKIENNHVFIEYGGKIFGHEINIRKFDEDWYFIDMIPRSAWEFAMRNSISVESYRTYYKADRFDTVLEFLKQFDIRDNDKKIFKAFESNSEEIYKSINNHEYTNGLLDKIKRSTISNSEISLIKENLPKTDTWNITKVTNYALKITTKNSQGDFFITKDNDEWYYVNMLKNFYKCDQLDGVIKLLSDKKLFLNTLTY